MIEHNIIKCMKCGDVIESTHRHDFNTCSCGSASVDGGHDYQRIIGDFDFIEIYIDGKFIPLNELPRSEEFFNDDGKDI